MKRKKRLIILLIIFALIPCTMSFSWEPYDRVIAVVNERPIVESDVISELNRLHGKRLSRRTKNYKMSRILDKFIEEAIVRQEAEEQYIIVSDKKIDYHIEKIMKRMNIHSKDDFIKRIEKTRKMSFDEYREDLRTSLITEQVMSIAIGVSPPTTEEALRWYNINKHKLGFELHVKHILVRPRNRSYQEEKRVSTQIKELRRRILAGESFEALAARYSQDPGSAGKGGDLGWVMLSELDPYFANNIHRMNRIGQISGTIKSGFGYHIVKYLGRRPITFDSVKDKIFNMLFQKKIGEQFEKWVARRKIQSDIRIYMENYTKS